MLQFREKILTLISCQWQIFYYYYYSKWVCLGQASTLNGGQSQLGAENYWVGNCKTMIIWTKNVFVKKGTIKSDYHGKQINTKG